MSRLITLSFLLTALGVFFACNAVETSSETTQVDQNMNVVEETPGYELATLVRLEKRPPIEDKGLHNVFVLSKNIISGSEPMGTIAFNRLQEMGVKTILSVDGKLPDVEMAKQYGMKYVHVPIQYKGIEKEALTNIVKTFRELDGPFYVHCFHGRHRGPAASAVGRLVLDGVSRETAIAEMRQWFGTSSKYGGLYDLIARGEIPSESETKQSAWKFDAAHKVTGIAGSMVTVSRSHDALKVLAKSDWTPTAEHPDVDPVNEAGILLESYEQMMALPEVTDGPHKLQVSAKKSVDAARELQKQLRLVRDGDKEAVKAAFRHFKVINRQCNACHSSYRNQ